MTQLGFMGCVEVSKGSVELNGSTHNGTTLNAQTFMKLILEMVCNGLEPGGVDCEERLKLLNLLKEILRSV